MKKVDYSPFRILFALVIGLVLVLWPDAAASYIVVAIGVFFLIPSVLSLLNYWRVRATERRSLRFPFNGVGSLLFGLWLIVMPDFFTHILLYLLGLVLVMGGVQLLATVWVARRWMQIRFSYYLAPLLIITSGVVCVAFPIRTIATVFMMMGVTCFVYVIIELLYWFRFTRHRPYEEVEKLENDKLV